VSNYIVKIFLIKELKATPSFARYTGQYLFILEL